MKAVILAAGEGTRLKPLTNVRPKPMIPVANRPILEYVVDAVADAGIDDIVLVVGYKRERIQNHFGDGDDWGVDITYAVQDKQLGTGNAILEAEGLIAGDFVALNGDRIFEPRLIEDVVAERRETGDAVMAVTNVSEPRLFGVVDTAGGRVVDIHEKPSARAVTSDRINAGVYAFGPEIFSAVRRTEARGELGITETLRQHLDAHPVRVVNYAGMWLDVTRPWDLITVNGRLLDEGFGAGADTAQVHAAATVDDDVVVGAGSRVRPGAVVLRGTAIGENVTVDPNVTLKNAVILPDATVRAGAVVQDCIVGANAEVGPASTVEGGYADVVLEGTLHRDVRFGGLVGDNAVVGGNVTVEPGTVLGNDATVGSGAAISGRIEPETLVRRG